MAKTVIANRNTPISRNVGKYSRSTMYHKSGAWAVKNRANKPATKTIKKVSKKSGKFYPGDDIKTPLRKVRTGSGSTKLRSAITPGTVLILVAGRFRGKRVVFLKQLESGLLLVTGPMAINGVPLRRVNQAYAIATSAKVDVSKVSIPESVNDEFFARPAAEKTAKNADSFANQKEAHAHKKKSAKSGAPSADRVKVQKSVDDSVVSAIKSVDSMNKYLNAKFRLTKNTLPHNIKF